MELICSIPGCRYPAVTVVNGNAVCTVHLEAEYAEMYKAQQEGAKEEPTISHRTPWKQPLRPRKK